ncbi:hypothetical protein NNJEOMEG_02652 [Fundidesulfovibrio magnetotacticus]|uniref:Uncharacterized protein n=1 Tax=Fundidesulfovibrio magnetotacticus TaxID=2730080 RepID=A0A6V8LST7_9BACT|nr:hypothetical protein [Fundidesulfovibrio magnetotacticus]GFK94804.1 hypothetical protein NNJEOMEG_02652 [Fundidesulfovibrio magnetotacticus]
MERVLLKLARQLGNYDEASLTSLWERYAEQVQRFEPSKRWEEAVLILSMIQAVRFKNQLFNLHWAEGREPGAVPPPRPHMEAVPNATADATSQPGVTPLPEPARTPRKPGKGKVLSFRHKDGDAPES